MEHRLKDAWVIPAAAILLLWPAAWNRYPIVFADTGTYLSQAIHRYAGWDRPVFYSLFIFPLHAMRSLWPVVVAQALLTAWLLRLVCRIVVPGLGRGAFLLLIAGLAAATWLPWLVSEVMPDLFTPLLVLLIWVLACRPGRWETLAFSALATFMIATQQSSLPLSVALIGTALGLRRVAGRALTEPCPSRHGPACPGQPLPAVEARVAGTRPAVTESGHDRGGISHHLLPAISAITRHLLPRIPAITPLLFPPILAIIALCSVNLAAHGRFAVSPFGNVFLLARIVYDGPGMEVLQRECPSAGWRLCAYRDRMPETSDAFLWTKDSPLNLAGGPKRISGEANAIIAAALRTDPAGVVRAALRNTLAQIGDFASGDGLNPWPAQVTPVITHDFSADEAARYAAARQQSDTLAVPGALPAIHRVVALAGVIGCVLLLPGAMLQKDTGTALLILVLLALPVNAAITGSLSAPHDRYQARLMWLPTFVVPLLLARQRQIGA